MSLPLFKDMQNCMQNLMSRVFQEAVKLRLKELLNRWKSTNFVEVVLFALRDEIEGLQLARVTNKSINEE